MKTWLLEEIGKFNLKENYENPVCGESEVIVEVKAAGICGSDIARVYENGAHRMPLIIGHEFSGIVKETNKRVGVFPLIPCRKCSSCLSKKYEMCTDYSYLGSRQDGGFAEYVSVPKWNLIDLPDNVSFEAAAMLEPMAVAVHAMRRLEFGTDEKIVVCGLGTIGQLLTMFLLEKGCKNIFVVGSKDIQKKTVLSFGIMEENYIDSKDSNLCEKVKDADVFFECVGKNETISLAIDSVKAAGQICMIGNPYSDLELNKNVYWKILRRQIRLTGTWNSSFYGESDPNCKKDDWHYVINLLKDEKINPENLITHRFEMDELKSGFEIMKNKTEEYLKIMMVR